MKIQVLKIMVFDGRRFMLRMDKEDWPQSLGKLIKNLQPEKRLGCFAEVATDQMEESEYQAVLLASEFL